MTDVNQPSDTSLLAHLEAILFSAAKPVPIALLGELFDCTTETVESLLEEYGAQLIEAKRGLRLKVSGVGAELVSASESSEYVSKIRQREDRFWQLLRLNSRLPRVKLKKCVASIVKKY